MAATSLPMAVENLRRRFSGYNLAVFDRYVNSEIGLVLKVKASLNAGVWDFAFRAIPTMSLVELNGADPTCSLNLTTGSSTADEGDKRMFAQIAHVVEHVQKIISSFVWLERPEKRLDFRWNILAKTPHSILKIGGAVGEGEGSKFHVRVTGGKVCGRPYSMVESGSQVLNNLGSENAPLERKWLSYSDFVNFVGAIRISLNSMGVWLLTEKARNLGSERFEMFSCPVHP
jgi:hypothetical protein